MAIIHLYDYHNEKQQSKPRICLHSRNYKFWLFSFSFCRYFDTPYTIVPAKKKTTVGVNAGYTYFTHKLSNSSGRKPVQVQTEKYRLNKQILSSVLYRGSYYNRTLCKKELIIICTAL